MPHFEVDDELAELIWRLASPKPFEQLTFSSALRRILQGASGSLAPPPGTSPESSSAAPPNALRSVPWQKKAQSPNPAEWAANVPELRGKKNLSTWQAICSELEIEVAGDSARRKLRNWVKANKPNWPAVPGIESDA